MRGIAVARLVPVLSIGVASCLFKEPSLSSSSGFISVERLPFEFICVNMRPRSVRFFLLILTAGLTVATATQLKVFRGTLVHSRVRTEMEVLQDHVIGFDEDNSGRVSTNTLWSNKMAPIK